MNLELTLKYVRLDWKHCNEVDVISETILLRDQLRRAAEKI